MAPSSGRALVAGVDSSTQSTKVVLRDLETGVVVAQASSPHPSTAPPISEQDPAAWWAALRDAFAQLGDFGSDVRALSVGGQQHGLVLVDEGDQVVRPAKLWNDSTSSGQADNLTAAMPPQAWAERCGSVPVAAFTITKLSWVLENEPEAAGRATKVMLPHDYLTWMLTGEHVTDRGDASGTGWFDPVSNTYRADLLDLAVGKGGDWLDRLPRVLRHDETAGVLAARAATDLGLPAGIPIGPGSGDNMAAALGLGLRPGDTAISLGTSGTVYATSATPTHDQSGAVAGFADATDNFLPLVCTLNATKVTDTVAAWLGTDAETLSELAMEADSTGDARPALVPYFDGERTPNLPHAAGQWVGLRNDATRHDLALSAFDGVLCGLLDGLDRLGELGVATDGRRFLIGGGAKSAAYRQRAADLSETPITVPGGGELVAAGAAVQAAAVAMSTTPADVAANWDLGTSTVVEPTAADGTATRRRYRDALEELYPT